MKEDVLAITFAFEYFMLKIHYIATTFDCVYYEQVQSTIMVKNPVSTIMILIFVIYPPKLCLTGGRLFKGH